MALIKRAFSVVFLLFVLVSGAGPAAAQIQGDFPQVVLFATNSMDVGASAEVFSGDVVVNNAPAGTLVFGNKAKTPAGWEVKANSIVVGNNVTLAGAEFCNLGNVPCAPGGLSLPVYGLVPIFKVSAPSGSNVTVPGGGSVTVSGNALDITVQDNGTLIFTPGVHNVRSITAGNKTNIAFSGPTEVLVQNGVSLGLEGNVNKLAGASANSVIFYVGGGAVLGSKSDVKANFYVPNGTLDVPGNTLATGAFLAKDLVIGSKAQFNLASAFVNHPPTAVDDAATVIEDASATTIGVLANDSDPDGDPILINITSDPAGGSVVITSGGADLTYQPDPDFCNDGSPTDDFTYEVCDNSTAINGNNCSTATVRVTVTCVNDAPVANDDSYNGTEDTALNVAAPGVLGNDTDVDSSITVSASDASSANGGTVGVAADGSFTYTPAANFCGTDTFGYTASDGALSDTATVTVEVACVNDAPVANDDSYNGTEDTALNVAAPGVLGNDTDVDSSLTVSASDASSANGASVGVAADGSFSYSPAANFCGTDTFGYTASDGALSDTATVTVEVACVNDAPVANDDSYNATEDTALNVAAPGVLGNDTDVDSSLTVSASDASSANGGTVGVAADGSFTYTPAANFCGTDTFGYTASDGALSDTATVTVEVACVNDAPVANDDSYNGTEDTALNVAAPGVLGNDTDVDSSLTVSASDASSANGASVSVAADGSFSYSPAADFCGTDTFGYTASDGALSDTATVTVEVACVNDAPVANDDTATVDENSSVVIPVLANDTDVDNANPGELTVSVNQGATSTGLVTSDGEKLTYTPSANFFGEARFSYTVCDLEPLCDSAEVVVTVNDLGDPPTATVGITATTSGAGDISINLSGTDPNGDSLVFSVVAGSGPTEGTLSGLPSAPIAPVAGTSTYTVTYTPNTADDLEDSFVFQVDDGNGGTSTAQVLINPGAESEPPTPNNVVTAFDELCVSTNPINCPYEVDQDEGVSITLRGDAPCEVVPNTPDPEDSEPCDGFGNDVPLTFSNLTGSSGATLVLTQGTGVPQRTARVEYTPPSGFTGIDVFTFQVDGDLDGQAGGPDETAIGTVEVAVSARAVILDVVAEDQTVATEPETPVAIDLGATQSGGVGGPHEFASFSASAVASSSGGTDANGQSRKGSGGSVFGGPATLTINSGGGWSATTSSPPAFFWSGYDGQTPKPANDGPFDFTGPACVSVTDDFQRGDQFRVKDTTGNFTFAIGETSLVPRAGGTGGGIGPDAAFLDPGYSSGVFEVGAGSHSITIDIIGNSLSGGRGYIRVDPIGSAWCNGAGTLTYTILSLPTGGSLTYRAVGQSAELEDIPITSVPFTLPQQGSLNLNTVTYTPAQGTTGGTAANPVAQFSFSVSNGFSSDTGLVGLYIVDAVVVTQTCTFNGRDVGCTPGAGPSAGGPGPGGGGLQSGGLAKGSALTVSVSGPGDVSSSRPHADGKTYAGLVCSSDSDCGANFVEGSTVALYARPVEAGSEFVEWGGDCYGADPVALIRVGKGTHCTATFRKGSD